jgi:hypothetical protein
MPVATTSPVKSWAQSESGWLKQVQHDTTNLSQWALSQDYTGLRACCYRKVKDITPAPGPAELVPDPMTFTLIICPRRVALA